MQLQERVDSRAGWQPVVRCLVDVRPSRIEWLWPGRIAVGKFTLLIGEPGLGKSLLSLDLAARVSRGYPWPEGESSAPQGSVLLLSGEDDVADTVVPRLESLGADLSRVRVMDAIRRCDGEEEIQFTLGRHLTQLEEALAEMDHPRLVIVDPISSYLHGLNSHSNGAVRRMLTSLGQLAQRRQVAVLAITHLVKNASSSVLGRALGSIAFAAAARAVWLVTSDPLHSGRQLLIQVKNNLQRRATGLAFRLSSGAEGARLLEWDCTPIELTADQVARLTKVLLRDAGEAKVKTPREEAAKCLKELMADGPRMGRELLREAEAQGFALRTIRRALREMNATCHRTDVGDYYYMLPGQEKDLPETGVWLWLQGREMAREMGG